MAIVTSIQAQGNGRFALVLLANGQTRRLEGSSCSKVAEAAALLIALLLDPSRSGVAETQRTPSPSDAGAGESKLQAAPSERLVVNDRPAPSRQSRGEPTKAGRATPLSGILEVGIRLERGSWPELEPAMMAGFGVAGLGWRLLTHVGIGRRIELKRNGSAELDVVPVTFDIEPAFRLDYRQWSLEPGVGLELGLNRSHSDVLTPRNHDTISVAVLALVRGKRDLGAGVGVWVGFGAGSPIVKPRWVDEGGSIYHAFGPSIRAELGVQLGF